MVRRKEDRIRIAYFYDGAAGVLNDGYPREAASQAPYSDLSGKVAKFMCRGISTEATTQMLKKRADQAGLDKPITWHDFRRTFAGNLLEAGHDLVTVQKLMGHATPVTSSLYDRRGEETKRRAVRSLHEPYKRKH